TSTTTVITRTRDTSQPRMKPRPFLVPSLVLRIKMKADSRNGCRAIPRAMRTRSATTPHLVPVADHAAAVLAPDHRSVSCCLLILKERWVDRFGIGYAVRLAQRLERGAHLGGKQVWLLPRGEVAAPVGLVEVAEVGVDLLGPAAGGPEDLAGERGEAHRERY